ncbi:MAG: GNAT family N-acetyltransferase [Kofleriaceae bacterium]
MQVRDASANDFDVYVRLFRELGVDEGTVSRDRFSSDLCRRMLVATDVNAMVGYLLYEILDGTGYVRNVVSDPDRRRSGIGHALMDHARERFVGAGASTWCLNVKADNLAAISLYEKVGMTLRYRTTVLRLPRTIALAAPDPAYTLVPVPPDTDEVVEARFHLLAGQLASARTKPGRLVAQLVHDGDVVGVGVFAAAIPGSFPWRLVAREHAAAFLGQLREHTPDEASWLQVGVEDDDALVEHVRALGAYVHLELLHMHGSIA